MQISLYSHLFFLTNIEAIICQITLPLFDLDLTLFHCLDLTFEPIELGSSELQSLLVLVDLIHFA
jgi:hypothetical protein